MTLPDFLIIGGQKCGTSAIWHSIVTHPDVDPTKKEKNFFNFYWHKGLDFYSDMFKDPNKINGDASPGYLFSPDVPERVKEVIPNTKIIVSLRNPIDRAYSQYNHQLPNYSRPKYWIKKLGRFSDEYEKVPTFEEALDMQKDFIERGYYADQLKLWFNHFPKDQFLIIKFEDFVLNNQQTMTDIQEFLELKVINLNPNKRFSGYDDMQPKTRRFLKKHFNSHNQKLNELLNKDFDW